MPLYDIFGSTAPVNLSNVDGNSNIIGTRFRITSSVVRLSASYGQYFSASVWGAKVYRGNLYSASYTCSVWRVSDQVMMGTTCSIGRRAVPYGWESASFDPPISLSLDTDYIIGVYGYANSYCYSTNTFTSNYYSNSLWNPIAGIHTAYTNTGSQANPAPPSYPNPGVVDNNWHGRDVIITASLITYPLGNTRGMSTQCVNGYMQGITLGSPTSIHGDSPMGRHLQVGVTQSLGEGFLSPPSLKLEIPGFWRFRWVVKAGPRAIYVSAKQNSTGSIYRPSVILKQNNDVGLAADLSASAAAGGDWQQIPMAFTATGNGVVWVELWNNDTNDFNAPAFFDHIITT